MIIKNNRPHLYYQLEQFNVKGYHLPIESFQMFQSNQPRSIRCP